MLHSFSVENYRSFARQQNIDLRPLTLFFGWNSGGKSALLRFLPLIAESLHVGGPPIWLGGAVGRHATWPSLACKATGRSAISFSLKWGIDNHFKSEWKVGGDSDGTYQEIESIEIGSVTQNLSQCNWSSLLPSESAAGPLSHDLQVLRKNLTDLRNDVQWISGVRSRPPRIATYGGGSAGTLSPDGTDAVDHLIAAQLRSTADPVLEATRSFFADMGEQLVLDNPIAGVWRLLLHPAGGPQVRVDLCDTGEGYSQVLPVLVALARAQNGGPRLLCLEQPELHLHTRAQVQLAKQLIATVKSTAEPRLLVETHSEILLTAIQLAIAEGVLAPDLVRVYWVETRTDGTSDAVPVSFNEQGQPDSSSLAGAFSEAIQLGQELISRQLSKY